MPQAKAKRQSNKIDYRQLQVEKEVPLLPRAAGSDRNVFLNGLNPGDSFLVETAKAGGLVTAINKLFGKGAGAKRQVDLEYSRVYRVH